MLVPACRQQYRNITTGVADGLRPYFDFVACARRAMGPPRRWRSASAVWGFGSRVWGGTRGYRGLTRPLPFWKEATHPRPGGNLRGQITLAHRYHGFAIDGLLTSYERGSVPWTPICQ